MEVDKRILQRDFVMGSIVTFVQGSLNFRELVPWDAGIPVMRVMVVEVEEHHERNQSPYESIINYGKCSLLVIVLSMGLGLRTNGYYLIGMGIGVR
jgi:hypothetical protein